jgi:hypothetical protein
MLQETTKIKGFGGCKCVVWHRAHRGEGMGVVQGRANQSVKTFNTLKNALKGEYGSNTSKIGSRGNELQGGGLQETTKIKDFGGCK